MTYPSITFIGGGNMACGILGGLLKQDFPATKLRVVDPNENVTNKLRKRFAIETYAQAHSDLLDCDYVMLATKPQILKSVCADLGKVWSGSNARIISIAAGIRSESIATWLQTQSQKKHTVIRAMPNTPALIGLGATGLFTLETLDDETTKTVETIFSAIGISVWLESEDQMDTVTALSGSGPAYFFRMLEALIEAGVDQGLSLEQSEKLVLQTALGAAHMTQSTLSNELNLASLRESVTSKGGTTEAGLHSLQANDFSVTLKKAVKTAKQRSIELSKEFI